MTQADTTPATDRRRDARHEVDLAARLTLVGLTVDGRLRNVASRGVCFVTSNDQVRVAESNFVRIEFTMPLDGVPTQVSRYVRIVRIDRTSVDGVASRRIGLAWDEPLAVSADRG
ncbi:MAG: PilZ domain-containing protein [Planctomycetes bacterium]|nr:PilZ domain-containing protein [Planctomycetota bacterium]